MARNARNGYFPLSPAATTLSSTNLRPTVRAPTVEPTNEPERRVLRDGFWEYGRFYGSWKPGKYLFPIDSEELNRLDIFHKFFLVVRGDRICSFPLSREVRPKIIDLGTGTGIWAFSVVEEFYKNAEVMAIDFNQIQPALIPRSVTTIQFDFEEPSWEPLFRDCDLIYLRLLYGSINDDNWPNIYRKVSEHLAPGKGYVEHLEIDWSPQWEDGNAPVDSAHRDWSQQFQHAMTLLRRSVKISSQDTKRMMEAAGLIDFTETTIRCHVSPWSPARHDQEAARWFNLAFSLGLEAMSMAPMIKQLHMTEGDVKDICAKVKKEICDLRNHAYCTLHIWTAKKPPSLPQ